MGNLHWCKKRLSACISFVIWGLWTCQIQELLIQLYSAGLCTSVAVCFFSGTKSDKNWLQQTVKTAAEKIISAPLPPLVTSKVRKRQAVIRDPLTVFAAGNLSHEQLPLPNKVSYVKYVCSLQPLTNPCVMDYYYILFDIYISVFLIETTCTDMLFLHIILSAHKY